jgi:alpha-L-fucosidase
MLVVDRTVAGEFENYTTPEQTVPKSYLPYPWESCITLGGAWGHVPNERYKSARTIIHLLTNIVSRNGSLLLNIGPRPDGEWDSAAYTRLEEIGAWMKVNSEAIYSTEADPNLKPEGKWVFTKKANTIYAIYQTGADEKQLPETAEIPLAGQQQVKSVSLLGSTAKLKVKAADGKLLATLSKATTPPCEHAWVYKITLAN